MNDAPVPPFQPTPPSEADPVTQPAQNTVPQPYTPQGSQAFSITSLVLGITSLVLAIVFFLSIPAAIVAIIMGIIVLVKHRSGKGKAIAGIITGGLALLVIPFILVVTIVAYNGVTQKANDAVHLAALQQQAEHPALAPSSDGTTVTSPCFTYTVPSGYVFDDTSVNCTTAVNIPNGDSLTRITVKGNTGTIGSLQDVVTMFNKTLKSNDATTKGVIDQQTLTLNGKTAYYISYQDANGLLFGNYIIPDDSASQIDQSGKTITGYTVAGYVYNSSLKGMVTNIFNSLKLT